MRRGIVFLALVVGLLGTVALAHAEDQKLGGLKLSGFVDAQTIFQQSLESDGDTDFTFAATEFELDIEKDFKGKASLRADIELVYQTEPLDGDGEAADAGFKANVEQLIAGVPFLDDFELSLGKFNSPVGTEGFDQNEITTITHSLLWSLVEPLSLTGLTLDANIIENVTITAMLFNGFDNNFDWNTGKGYGLQAEFTQGDDFSAGVTYLLTQGMRDVALTSTVSKAYTHLLVAQVEVNPIRELALAAQLDYRRDENTGVVDLAGGPSLQNTDGLGVMFRGAYQLADDLLLTMRYEFYQDGLKSDQPGTIFDGVRPRIRASDKNSIDGVDTVRNSFNTEFTGAFAYTVTDGAVIKAEYRIDRWDMDDIYQVAQSIGGEFVFSY